MNGLSRTAAKTSVAALALTIGLAFADVGSASAQSCDPPGAANVAATGTIVPQVITQATNIINGITSSFNSFIGPVVGGLNLLPGGGAGPCMTLLSCTGQWFAQLSQTSTNAATTMSGVMAKQADYAATSNYSLHMQGEQAHLAIDNGVGTGGSNTLAYQNNNLCVTTTVASGMAQASAEADGNTVGDPFGSTNGASVPAANQPPFTKVGATSSPTTSSVQNVNALYTAGQQYVGTDPTSNEDENPGYLDTVLTYAGPNINHIGVKTAAGTTTVLSNKVDDAVTAGQYTDYITGLPPEVPPASAKDSSGQQAFVAQREKLAYFNTAALAFKAMAAYRQPTSSSAAPYVQQMYNVAGLGTAPGNISKAQLMDAAFRGIAEDSNTLANLPGMGGKQILANLTAQTIMGNYLNYERFIVERRNLLVNSAMLSLMVRQANFAAHP